MKPGGQINRLCLVSATGELYFIDETSLNTKMTRQRGRAKKGLRVNCYVPYGHWRTSTFVGALNSRGMATPMVLDGPMNGEAFLAYVHQFLVPELKKGDVVVLDNLSSHKVKGVMAEIRAVGAKVAYLPPYSPGFNPIEQAFSKLKEILRKEEKETFKICGTPGKVFWRQSRQMNVRITSPMQDVVAD